MNKEQSKKQGPLGSKERWSARSKRDVVIGRECRNCIVARRHQVKATTVKACRPPKNCGNTAVATRTGLDGKEHRMPAKSDRTPEGEEGDYGSVEGNTAERASWGILGARKHGNEAMTGTAGEAVFPAA